MSATDLPPAEKPVPEATRLALMALVAEMLALPVTRCIHGNCRRRSGCGMLRKDLNEPHCTAAIDPEHRYMFDRLTAETMAAWRAINTAAHFPLSLDRDRRELQDAAVEIAAIQLGTYAPNRPAIRRWLRRHHGETQSGS